jgi:hypothetical protein
MVMIHEDFKQLSKAVHTYRWQGSEIIERPEMKSFELLNYHMEVPLRGVTDLDYYAAQIKPNLPWADNHFFERIGGEPLNPGIEWANWPWASSADTFRADGRFNHSYMERLWPKYARSTSDGRMTTFVEGRGYPDREGTKPHAGINGLDIGDLRDLVELLANEPDTRQAWIPLFFPEDTGRGDGGRKPCTLGYQFIIRQNQISIYYPLRSCDFVRHFRDDVYLAIRLLLWVLDECRKINPEYWNNVYPGTYVMHCTSFHIFRNDWIMLFGEDRK